MIQESPFILSASTMTSLPQQQAAVAAAVVSTPLISAFPQHFILTQVPGQQTGFLHPTTTVTPVFLTSTINQPAFHSSFGGISTWRQQPQTPTIVVGSNGNPFFSATPVTGNQLSAALSNAHLQQRQHHHHHEPHFSLIATSPDVPLPINVPCSTTHEILISNKQELEQCYWYYAKMNWNESSELLQNSQPGTFLVRDSSDQKFLFSLSVQRAEGPTSVRIHFHHNRFSLDAEDSIRHLMPKFESVISLIDHYCSSTAEKDKKKVKEAFIESRGTLEPQISSPISLRFPCFRTPPSLAHFSRLAINRQLAHAQKSQNVDLRKKLNLPTSLVNYLEIYKHRV
jgi:hypothetical protein